MGDNAVYRKQFYTKLVSSCHFMFLYYIYTHIHIYMYMYVCMQLFFLVLLKTRERKRSYSMAVHVQSNSELAEVVLILSPADMWFLYYCQKRVSASRWSKIPPGRRGSCPPPEADLTHGGQIFSQRIALHGDKIECSTLMSTWPPRQVRQQLKVGGGRLEPRSCVPSDLSSNRRARHYFLPFLFHKPLKANTPQFSRYPKSSQMKFGVCSGVIVVSRLSCLLI